MSGFLGIDHPLVAVRDLDATAERYGRLGFIFKPGSRHPWGTAMRVIQMRDSSIELITVCDPNLLDAYGPAEFRFGRHVSDRLDEREGIAMIALHSKDAEADAAAVLARGVACQGTIDFGRPVVTAAGEPARTRTTLKLLGDGAMPRLSNFICHQHRPELIYRPEFQQHPNGAIRICCVTILAERTDWPLVRRRLAGLYGEAAVSETTQGFLAHTGNGIYAVMDRAEASAFYGGLPATIGIASEPLCLAIHVEVADPDRVAGFVETSGLAFRRTPDHLHVLDASALGGVFITFDAVPQGRAA